MKRKQSPPGEILFRNLTRPRPRLWSPNLHWQIEFHATHTDMAYPLGIAYVSAGKVCCGLDFIFVVDKFRRRGIGKQLILACQKRWPGIELGEAISKVGQYLLDSVETIDPAPSVAPGRS